MEEMHKAKFGAGWGQASMPTLGVPLSQHSDVFTNLESSLTPLLIVNGGFIIWTQLIKSLAIDD